MQIAKNKTIAIAIAIFLMLSMSASTMLIPSASAHTPAWNIPTFAYIDVAPNPIGVGQVVHVYMWVDKVIANAAINNDIRFKNYELTITAPNGAKTTQTFATVEDTTSSQYTTYTPTAAGTYNFTFNFPAQVYTYTGLVQGFFGPPTPNMYTNDTYLASSASTTLTVQSTPIPAAVFSSPLPTAYWTRPIFGLNTAWWSISSNWLGTGSGQFYALGFGSNVVIPDAVGPQTSHVMWTMPIQPGGIVGGNDFPVQGVDYMDGTAYVTRFGNPIILDGMLYFHTPVGETGGTSGPLVCINLQTGQQIWSNANIPSLNFGYVYDMYNPNYHGVWPPILVAVTGGYNEFTGSFSPTAWQGYDGYTGDQLFTATNIPSGTTVLGPSGEELIYTLYNAGTPTSTNWELCQWNSSDMGVWGLMGTGSLLGTINAGAGSCYDWNVSIPWLNTMAPTIFSPMPTVAFVQYNDMMLCYNGTLPSAGTSFYATSWTPYTFFAVNLNPAKAAVGTVLWWNTLTPPAGNITVVPGGWDPTTGVWVELYKETMNFVGFSLATGAYLWGPTPEPVAMDYYGNDFGGNLDGQLAYGNLYSCGFGGVCYCYNDTTGKLEWTYGNGGTGNSTNAGFYNPYGDYPTMIVAIGNGVIYTETAEHTVTSPIYRGALTRAINATNGKEIWTLPCYGSSWNIAIADGYATMLNGYDMQVYTVGRGPSATTVQAPLTSITAGDKVVIQGTVMDVSAGTKQTEQAADFPNGVPVASDASMSNWMSYVYQQQPEPTNFTGVTVTLTAIDPNSNPITLGTATTDSNGMFHFTWTPPSVPGTYSITAAFVGTNGYWGSNAETNMIVQNAPSATAAPTATPTSVANTYFVPAIAGLFVLIIVVAIVLALLMLRKRP